jgi:hypothetical protein
MKTMVDDLSVLAVEKCLVKRLPDLLSPETIIGLDDATIIRIAAETEESRLERSRVTEKLKVLESTLVVLRSLDRHKPACKFMSEFQEELGAKINLPFSVTKNPSPVGTSDQAAVETITPAFVGARYPATVDARRPASPRSESSHEYDENEESHSSEDRQPELQERKAPATRDLKLGFGTLMSNPEKSSLAETHAASKPATQFAPGAKPTSSFTSSPFGPSPFGVPTKSASIFPASVFGPPAKPATSQPASENSIFTFPLDESAFGESTKTGGRKKRHAGL